MSSFRNWLWKQTKRQDPVGDLARDMKIDQGLPPVKSLKGYMNYLDGLYACENAKTALKTAWMEYQHPGQHS